MTFCWGNSTTYELTGILLRYGEILATSLYLMIFSSNLQLEAWWWKSVLLVFPPVSIWRAYFWNMGKFLPLVYDLMISPSNLQLEAWWWKSVLLVFPPASIWQQILVFGNLFVIFLLICRLKPGGGSQFYYSSYQLVSDRHFTRGLPSHYSLSIC